MSRTIGSTIIGQALDSFDLHPRLYGIWQNSELIKILAFNWLFKISIEVIFTPITYAVVGFLKRENKKITTTTRPTFPVFTSRLT